MTVNISAQFTEDTRLYNGLLAIEEQLVEDPHHDHTIIARVRTKFIKEDVENGGTKTPTILVVHVEAMVDEADTAQATALMLDRFKTRTNGAALPQDPLPIGEDGAATERTDDVWLDEGQANKPAKKRR